MLLPRVVEVLHLPAGVRVSQCVTSSGSYLSASDKRVYFGLGAAAASKIDVKWPSGIGQKLDDVQNHQLLPVVEPGLP